HTPHPTPHTPHPTPHTPHPTPHTPHPTPHTPHPAPFPDQWQKSSLKPQNQSILPPWWHSIAPVSAVSGRYRDINGN
ncbi:hypothetical protein, partial [Microcystis sp. M53602_WE12]|uniref:hypothetical protein n=1 Tax=Microcystis sp. M53602_WE12 TaxID=3030674 RepID=UPI00258749C3